MRWIVKQDHIEVILSAASCRNVNTHRRPAARGSVTQFVLSRRIDDSATISVAAKSK